MVVNPTNKSITSTIRLTGFEVNTGSVVVGQLLTSGSRADDNGPTTQTHVSPVDFYLSMDGTKLTEPMRFPPISFITLRFTGNLVGVAGSNSSSTSTTEGSFPSLEVASLGPQTLKTDDFRLPLKTEDDTATVDIEDITDTVDFGSPTSLLAHNATSRNASAVVGGLGQRGLEFMPLFQPAPDPPPHGYRPVVGTGWVKFDVKIDPTAATHYITLKLWGESCRNASVCITQLHRPALLMDVMGIADFEASQFATSQEGHASASNPNPCTLDFSSSGGSDTAKYDGPAPGIFQYSTYILPSALTKLARNDGNGTRTLSLAVGSGTYQTYGPPSLARSRTLYKAFIHGESGYIDLSNEVPAGALPPPAPPLPPANSTVQAAVVHLQREIVAALVEVGSWQEWGPAFEESVKLNRSFALFRGVPTAGSCRGPHDAAGFPEKTGYQYCIDRKNLSPMRQLEVYAMAWKSSQPWAAGWSQNQSVLDRIAAGLDFFAVAQGANGVSQSTQYHPPAARRTQNIPYCIHNACYACCLLESTLKSRTNSVDGDRWLQLCRWLLQLHRRPWLFGGHSRIE